MKSTPKIVLDICCAPCATAVIKRLREKYTVIGYFNNPNIHPIEEYQKRLASMKRLADRVDLPVVYNQYSPERWFERVNGLEDEPEGGKRCEVCFRYRLENALKFTEKQGIDIFTTTLTISPQKNAELINKIGKQVTKDSDVTFLEANFKKQDGFKRSVELSKQYDLYRQHYCGCIFSRR